MMTSLRLSKCRKICLRGQGDVRAMTACGSRTRRSMTPNSSCTLIRRYIRAAQQSMAVADEFTPRRSRVKRDSDERCIDRRVMGRDASVRETVSGCPLCHRIARLYYRCGRLFSTVSVLVELSSVFGSYTRCSRYSMTSNRNVFFVVVGIRAPLLVD